MELKKLLISGICLVTLVNGCAREQTSIERAEHNAAAYDSLEPIDFNTWKESVRAIPGKDFYAVGNDLAAPLGLVGDEQAREYYDRHIGGPGALLVGNARTSLSAPDVANAFPPGSELTYCVDREEWDMVEIGYGIEGAGLYSYVEEEFANAAAVWNASVGYALISHVASRDGSCNPTSGDQITWYVKPLAWHTGDPVQFLTFVLQPREVITDAEYRVLFVLDYLVQHPFPGALHWPNDPDWNGMFSLRQLFLHTLSRGLGFIPEQNRGFLSDSFWPGECHNQNIGAGAIILSEEDPFSVTTTPLAMEPIASPAACLGIRDRGYEVTYRDAMGASCQYRNDSTLYWCSASAQESIAGAHSPECGPYPLEDISGCDAPDTSWQDDATARGVHTAILESLL